jgi:hypothetical protein
MDSLKRSSDEEHPVFRRSRNPISLPSDTMGRPSRGTGVTIAILLITCSLAAGLLHEFFWEKASEDAARLLPGTSRAYLEAETPAQGLDNVSTLDRWSNPKMISSLLSSQKAPNLFFNQNTLGLPYGSLFEVMRNADSISVAEVPTSRASGTVVLVRVADNTLRKQLWRRLQPHLRTHDRHLGYHISVLNRTRRALPWSEPVLPLYFVEMSPFIGISYGPVEALHQVLHAKVGTTTEPVRSRPSFDKMQSATKERSGVRGFLTPDAVFDSLFESRASDSGGMAAWRSVWMSEITSLSWVNYLLPRDDITELSVHLPRKTDPDILTGGQHTLLNNLPSASIASLSVNMTEPGAALSGIEAMLKRLHRKAKRPTALIGVARQLRYLKSILFEGTKDDRLPLQSEMVLSFLDASNRSSSEARWVLLAQLKPSADTDEQIRKGLKRFLGERFSTGYRSTEQGRLHMIRPARASKETESTENLVWRLRNNIFELAPTQSVFADLDVARLSGRTYDHADILAQSTQNLFENPSILLILNPFRGPWASSPWVRLVAKKLKATYRIALTGRLVSDRIEFRANIGLWTPLIALLTANQNALDALTLRTLSAPCRNAFLALCREIPSSIVCRLTNPERADIAVDTCNRLGIPAN